MRTDKFGPLIQQAIEQAGPQGLSAGEIIEAVHCSRQRVYAWLRANTADLAESGRTEAGGTRYAWRQHTVAAPKPAGADTPAAPVVNGAGIEVGVLMTVTRMRWVAGKMQITLAAPDGTEVEATA